MHRLNDHLTGRPIPGGYRFAPRQIHQRTSTKIGSNLASLGPESPIHGQSFARLDHDAVTSFYGGVGNSFLLIQTDVPYEWHFRKSQARRKITGLSAQNF